MYDEQRTLHRMTDSEFNEKVLKPALAEAKRRRFTINLDPFDVLPRPPRKLAFEWPRHPREVRR